MAVKCRNCHRPIGTGEVAWASEWTVIDADVPRRETRFDCDDCNDPTAYDLPMTGTTHLRPGERRNLA